MNRSSLLILVMLIVSSSVFSQVKDYEIGSSTFGMQRTQGGYFDYSDPESVNIKIGVWGFVKYPGRYLVPINTTVSDMLSYTGGPTDDARLEDLRIYRTLEDSTQKLIKFSYNDLLWEDDLTKQTVKIPDLNAGDILLIPGEPRLYFRDWFSISLSVFSALISLTILIINIAE